VGDLNGDGKPDLVTANSGNGTVSVLQNVVDAPGNLTISSFAPKIDLAVPPAPFRYRLWILTETTSRKSASPLICPRSSQCSIISVPAAHCRQIRSVPALIIPQWPGHTISVGDLDGDTKPDVVVDTELNSLISVFRNQSTPGTLISSSLATQVELGGGYNSWGSSVGDLDGDGRPDIAFVNTYDSNLSLYQNLSAFGGPPQILTQPTNQSVLGNTTASFSALVTGQSPVYQWLFNGTNLADNGRIIGAQTSSLNILIHSLRTRAITIWWRTNGYGAVTSLVATLTVQIVPAYLTQQPQSSNTLAGKLFRSPSLPVETRR